MNAPAIESGKRQVAAPETQRPRTANVLLAGVGGRGVLVASEVLAFAAVSDGLEAKQSEVHGVAQRGGSVVSHVRFGQTVHSPLIPCGDADLLYGGEPLEALRYAHYVRPGGTFFMDDRVIKPIQLPDEPDQIYPQGIAEFLRGKGYEIVPIPAFQAATELGEPRCANIVLLGALSTRLGLSDAAWQASLQKRLPAKIVELNRRAFARGRELAGAPG